MAFRLKIKMSEEKEEQEKQEEIEQKARKRPLYKTSLIISLFFLGIIILGSLVLLIRYFIGWYSFDSEILDACAFITSFSVPCFLAFLLLAGIHWVYSKLNLRQKKIAAAKFLYGKIRAVKWYWWLAIAGCLLLIWISFNLYWKSEIEEYAEDVKAEIRRIMGEDFEQLPQKKNAYFVIEKYKEHNDIRELIENDFEPVKYINFTEEDLETQIALRMVEKILEKEEEKEKEEEPELTLDEKFLKFKEAGGVNALAELQELKDCEVLAHPYFYTFDIETLHVHGIMVSSYGRFSHRSQVFENMIAIASIMDFACMYYAEKEKWDEYAAIYDLAFHLFNIIYVGDRSSLELKSMFCDILVKYTQLNPEQVNPETKELLVQGLISISERLEDAEKLHYLFWTLYIYSNYKMGLHRKHIAMYGKMISVFPTMCFHFFMENMAYYYANYISDTGEKDPDAPEYSYDFVLETLRETGISDQAFKLYFSVILRSHVEIYENTVKLYMSILPFMFNEYKKEHGTYPAKFTSLGDVVKGEIVKDDLIEFAGYRIVFIENTSDRKKYSDPEVRKERFALCAVPIDYATTGCLTFIVNEKGIVYHVDTGRAESFKDYPADPEDGWETGYYE